MALLTVKCTLLLAPLIIAVAGAAAGDSDCDAKYTQIVEDQRQEIARLQGQVQSLLAGEGHAARRAEAPMESLLAGVGPAARRAEEAAPTMAQCNGQHRVTTDQGLEPLRGCSSVGTLQIRGSVTSLEALSSLQTVQVLDISFCHSLRSLVGLEGLKTAGQLAVQWNSVRELVGLWNLQSADQLFIKSTMILTLRGLQNLTRVGLLWIEDNFGLMSLAGVPSLQNVEELFISENDRLPSLAGLDNLARVEGGLHVTFNNRLESLAGLQSLKVVGGMSLMNNPQLKSIAGLQSLVHVKRTLQITGSGMLPSLEGLENLTDVGELTLRDLPGISSLQGLRGLTRAWAGVRIKSCDLDSLDGLGALRSGALLVESTPLMHLGAPFAAGASISYVEIDSASWPRCVTPHERRALLSVVENRWNSHVPEQARWGSECTPYSGNFNCTRGQPCSLSFTGEERGRIFISGRFTGCGACSESHVQGLIAESGMVDLGYALNDHEGGLRSICNCSSSVGPVGQLLLQGPTLSSVTACSRGRNCTLKVDGEALQRTDHVVLMSSCSGNPRKGFPASWVAENTYRLHEPATWYAAPPSTYQVCWRAPCTAARDGPRCPAPEDPYIHVGEVELHGAYPRNHSAVLGDRLQVPNIGLGVADGDEMRLRRAACGEAREEGPAVLSARSSGLLFDFGRLREDRAQVGRYHLCWCQEREGVTCNAERHFTADAGVVEILCPAGHELTDTHRCGCPAGTTQGPGPGLQPCLECPAGQFSTAGEECQVCPSGTVAGSTGSSACVACKAWQFADEDAEGCSFNALMFALLAVFLLSVGGVCGLLVHGIRRRLSLVDVSNVDGHTILTTFGSHGLANFGRRSFPVTLRRTCLPGLDSPRRRLRAVVKDANSLELLTAANEPINDLLDSSMGTLTVAFPHDLLHVGWPLPMAVSLPLLLAVAGALSSMVVMNRAIVLGAAVAALVFAAVAAALRWWPRTTPIERRLSAFKRKLAQQPPNHRCEDGPNSAIAIGKLHELLHFFHDFIRDRNVSYLDTNILKQLTKAKKTSYAELAGGGPVEWFVSHFWGSHFEHFCRALRKHAESVCDHRDWRELHYWAFFCSCSQHRGHEELGARWEELPVNQALRSAQGTCMILDDEALPLTRIWCIYELLQTLKLERNDVTFKGLHLCTTDGPLHTSVEGSPRLAFVLVDKVARMDLEAAQATHENDKWKIHAQVIQEMGSSDALKHFVFREVQSMLVRSRERAQQHFVDMMCMIQSVKQDGESTLEDVEAANMAAQGAQEDVEAAQRDVEASKMAVQSAPDNVESSHLASL